MSKGTVYVISGPSGVGKDSILQGVLQHFPRLEFSRSCITRPMRPGETAEGKYRFVSVAEFTAMLEKGELLEYNEFVGNFYGTPRKPIDDCIASGRSIIVEVDVNGADNIKKALPECVRVFIMPPSPEILKERLCKRKSECPEAVERRLRTAVEEMKRAPDFDYVIVNDKLEEAVNQFCAIIEKREGEI